jgi:hypothetical protein
MARCRPRALKLVVRLENFYEGPLHLRKERSKLVDREKRLKETRLRVDLMSNSSFLNRDIGITGLVILNFVKLIIVSSSSVYLLFYSLVHNCTSALYSVMCSIIQ